MANEDLILDKLTEIANKLDEQNLLQKTVLNFNEAAKYLDVSPSHLYKLTSTKHIPHFCPQGNQPRLKLIPSTGSRFDFAFHDATGVLPGVRTA